MSTLTITKSYADTQLLEETHIDPFKNNCETFFNVTKINDDNLQNAGITASEKIKNGSINAAKIQTSAVVEASINDSAVTTAKINDSAVTTAKINDSAVTTAKINDSAVTTAKINDSAVTNSKTVLNYSFTTFSSVSSGTGTHTIATSSSLSLNSRPVFISAKMNASTASGGSGTSVLTINLKRNSTTIASVSFDTNGGSSFRLNFLDETGGSGATTYSVEAVYSTSGSRTFSINPLPSASEKSFLVREL